MKPVFGTLFIKDIGYSGEESCTSIDWTLGYVKDNTVWIPHIKPKFTRNEVSGCKKMIPKKEINIAYKGQLREGTREGPDPECFPWCLPEMINVFPELSEEELESRTLRLCRTEGITFIIYDKIS